MKVWSMIALLMMFGVAAYSEVSEPAWIGYGGPEGSRVYRNVTPPTRFGASNILWSVELPDGGWGHASPIVVGNKVFLHVEYDEAFNRFPSLIAINTEDGSIAWKAVLDHTPVLANGDKIREAWIQLTDMELERQKLLRAFLTAQSHSNEQASAAARVAIAAAGYETNKIDTGGYPKLRPPNAEDKSKGLWQVARQGGFSFETWREGLKDTGGESWCVGHAYATPVSDGKHIWVQTSFGGFFCFDLNGKQIWSAASPGQDGEYCRNGRSPILWKDPASGKWLLLSDIINKVRAFDAATGQLLWSDDGPATPVYGREGVGSVVTPAVLTVGGVPILWAAGCNAYRLPDGKKLTLEGWDVNDHGMQSLVKHDEPDVLFLCGNGEHCGWREKGEAKNALANGPNPPAALRFTLEGDPSTGSGQDTLKVTVLWHGGQLADKWSGRVGGGNGPWMLYHDGKFYHREGAILDALTGKIIVGQIYSKGQNQAVPATEHLLCVANGHVYGLGPSPRAKDGSATLSVYTLDGKKVTDNQIPGFASYGWAFTFDKSDIYVRGLRRLIKIGTR